MVAPTFIAEPRFPSIRPCVTGRWHAATAGTSFGKHRGRYYAVRYRDQPTIEVSQRVRCDVGTAWQFVTDIGLPARSSSELQAVQWLGDADRVTVGARFRGRNAHEALGAWETVCEVVEVEDKRRWVYDVVGPEGVSATWAFETEPASDGVLIRQWARMGPAPSGLSIAISASPEKEARIIARRLSEWRQNMQANLDWIRSQVED
ncbi:MAG: SRPBCC family protein, partial [Acidimicrobiales bacterium]